MNTQEITLVRIYVTESDGGGEGGMKALVHRLQEEEQVRGVTVFRAIEGFGPSGHMHSSGLVDLSLDLPLVIEFFDSPEKAARIMEDLANVVPLGHMVSWSARVNAAD